MTKTYHTSMHPDEVPNGHGINIIIDSRNGGNTHGMGTSGNDTFIAKTDGKTVNQIHMHAGDGDDTFHLDMGVNGSKINQHGHHIFGQGGKDKYFFDNIQNMKGTVVGRIDDFDFNSDEIFIGGKRVNFSDPDVIDGIKVAVVLYQGQQWLELINKQGGRALYALEGARQIRGSDGVLHEEAHFLSWDHKIPVALPRVIYEKTMNMLPATFFNKYETHHVISKGDNLWQDQLVSGSNASEFIKTQRGNDTIYGGEGNDRIHVSLGNDVVRAGVGHDIVEGDKGLDKIDGGDGNDTISGGSDADTITGGRGADLIFGGTENDILLGQDDNDVISGNGGNDKVYGGSGDDRLFGNSGNDYLSGDEGADSIFGAGGSDRIDGGDGADLLDGGAGSDTIHGDIGNDSIAGGAGHDLLVGEDGNDVILGGDHNDTVFGDAGEDKINGMAGNDILFGGTGSDTINGDGGNDVLNGGDDNDCLFGSMGNDTLRGDRGADSLYGGIGNDILLGGEGSDTFVFRSVAEIYQNSQGRDAIIDFNRVEEDKVDLRLIDSDTSTAGNQSFTFIGRSAFTNDSGQLRYETLNGKIFVSGDTNGDGKADFSLEMHGLSSVSGNDFLL